MQTDENALISGIDSIGASFFWHYEPSTDSFLGSVSCEEWIRSSGYPYPLPHADLVQWIDWEDRPRFLAAWARCLNGSMESIVVRVRLPHKPETGHDLAFYMELMPHLGSEPTIIGSIRVLGENCLEHALRQENFGQAWERLVNDKMATHVWVADQHGKFIYVNQETLRYSGLTPEQ